MTNKRLETIRESEEFLDQDRKIHVTSHDVTVEKVPSFHVIHVTVVKQQPTASHHYSNHQNTAKRPIHSQRHPIGGRKHEQGRCQVDNR